MSCSYNNSSMVSYESSLYKCKERQSCKHYYCIRRHPHGTEDREGGRAEWKETIHDNICQIFSKIGFWRSEEKTIRWAQTTLGCTTVGEEERGKIVKRIEIGKGKPPNTCQTSSTRGSAVAEGPRDVLCQLKSCQLRQSCTENHIWKGLQ